MGSIMGNLVNIVKEWPHRHTRFVIERDLAAAINQAHDGLVMDFRHIGSAPEIKSVISGF